MKTSGIHHVTAVAGDPQQNLDFYTEVLGLRLVKRTVNFDDTTTYHLYYGDETGSPGTVVFSYLTSHVRRTSHRSGALARRCCGLDWLVPTREDSERFHGKIA